MRVSFFAPPLLLLVAIAVGCGSETVSGPAAPSECLSPSDDDFCLERAARCGAVVGTDSCGNDRTVASCGSCGNGESCSANECVPSAQCQPEDDTVFCARNRAQCGALEALDNCGRPRVVSNCGRCGTGETCNASNQCGPVPSADAGTPDAGRVDAGLADGGAGDGGLADASTPDAGRADSGVLDSGITDAGRADSGVLDSGITDAGRVDAGPVDAGAPDSGAVDAGRADAGPMDAGIVDAGPRDAGPPADAGSQVDAGGCVRETDTAFCSRTGALCGSKTATDNCGISRTVSNCGPCSTGQQCDANTNRCVTACTPETDAAFCTRKSAVCGALVGTDNCGSARAVANCGACLSGTVCTAANVCRTPPCTPTGTFSAQGTVSSSGAVAPVSGTTSGTGSQTASCANGQSAGEAIYSWTPSFTGTATISATTQFDGMLYVRSGACDGPLAAASNVGDNVSCRDNAVSGQTESLTLNVVPQTTYFVFVDGVNGATGRFTVSATCNAESDQAICARLGKNCGALTGIVDNCGRTRNVASCGSCSGATTCGGGNPGVANVCGCTPETPAAFCTRLRKNCDNVRAADNCGVTRTVDCGDCRSPERCGGGTPAVANVCGCTSESDAQFCSRLGAVCGSKLGYDNCGRSKYVSNCGACGYGSTCQSNTCNVDWKCNDWQLISDTIARKGRYSTQSEWFRQVGSRTKHLLARCPYGGRLPSNSREAGVGASGCRDVFGTSSFTPFWTSETCYENGPGHRDSNGQCILDNSISFSDERYVLCMR
jgi:hypothetical protein